MKKVLNKNKLKISKLRKSVANSEMNIDKKIIESTDQSNSNKIGET